MDRQRILEGVKGTIAEVLGNFDAELGTRFKEDLSADSLDAIELVMELENRFGIEILDEEMRRMETVRDVVEYIVSRMAAEENQKEVENDERKYGG